MRTQVHGCTRVCALVQHGGENGIPRALRAGQPLQHCSRNPELRHVTNGIPQLHWKKGLRVFQPIRPPTHHAFWTASGKSPSKPEPNTRLSSGCADTTARHKVSALTHSPGWKLLCSREILEAQPDPAPGGERSTESLPPPPAKAATGAWRPLAPNLLLILCLSF